MARRKPSPTQELTFGSPPFGNGSVKWKASGAASNSSECQAPTVIAFNPSAGDSNERVAFSESSAVMTAASLSSGVAARNAAVVGKSRTGSQLRALPALTRNSTRYCERPVEVTERQVNDHDGRCGCRFAILALDQTPDRKINHVQWQPIGWRRLALFARIIDHHRANIEWPGQRRLAGLKVAVNDQ